MVRGECVFVFAIYIGSYVIGFVVLEREFVYAFRKHDARLVAEGHGVKDSLVLIPFETVCEIHIETQFLLKKCRIEVCGVPQRELSGDGLVVSVVEIS